jgi:hypothetical protein
MTGLGFDKNEAIFNGDLSNDDSIVYVFNVGNNKKRLMTGLYTNPYHWARGVIV